MSPLLMEVSSHLLACAHLLGQVLLFFPPGSINPPHTRVRAPGLLFLLQGTLEVGLLDTTNKLYTQTLQAGDIFVFPKGLVRYQYNPDSQTPALAIAAFGSSNPESVSIPNAVFNTGIDDIVLAKSLRQMLEKL